MSYEDLKTLDELRRTGGITEEEYQREKQKVLDGAEDAQDVPTAEPQPVYAAGGAGQGAPPPPEPVYTQPPTAAEPQPVYAAGTAGQGAPPPPEPVYTQPPQQPPPPPPYGGQSATGKPLFGMAENTYIMLMHLSQFLGAIIPGLGLAAPIILWALNKDANPRVDAAGKRIFNFLISFCIYGIAAGLLCIIVIGFLLLAAIAVVVVVFVILAAVKANNGEDWDYPLTIKFFR